jgi:peptidoglycan/LPS O-acetylase OafA/YrhL
MSNSSAPDEASSKPSPSLSPRYHALDALRAYAMFLGVVLHASMAYIPNVPWGSHDPAAADWVGLILLGIHGFRMQLFFVISGFFTLMLLQRRGVQNVIKHRFMRILLPCLLCLITVLPAQHAIEGWATRSEAGAIVRSSKDENATAFVNYLKADQPDKAVQLLAAGLDPNAQDPMFGLTMLAWAALTDDGPVAGELIKRGANVNGRSRNQSTPLNAAAFRGSVMVAQLLLEQNADTTLKSADGDTPLRSAFAPADATAGIATLLSIKLPPDADLIKGRQSVIRLLPGGDEALRGSPDAGFGKRTQQGLPALRSAYTKWLVSGVVLGSGPAAFNFFLTNVFDHLWFLWLLWWMVLILAAMTNIFDRIPIGRLTWLGKPWRIAILVIPTGILQALQGLFAPIVGPDTSIGLIPMPNVFVYYLFFFLVGALIYRAGILDAAPTKGWIAELVIANVVCFPLAIVLLAGRDTGGLVIGGIVQGFYAWLSIFGLIGFFRAKLSGESPVARYLSDASYFVYIFHIIVVLFFQHLLHSVGLPAGIKLMLVALMTTGILLGVYQLGVRYTFIGTLLNGKKTRNAD